MCLFFRAEEYFFYFDEAEEHAMKFIDKGVKAGANRARATLQKVRKLAQELRVELLAEKKAMSAPKEEKKPVKKTTKKK